MKKLKTASKIKLGDYIKAINKGGDFIIFKADYSFKYHTSNVTIIDTNIDILKSMIGKTGILSKFTLDTEFTMYKLNKFECWLYKI